MASEQITYADEQAELPNALEDSEIARIMKLVMDQVIKNLKTHPLEKNRSLNQGLLLKLLWKRKKNWITKTKNQKMSHHKPKAQNKIKIKIEQKQTLIQK